MHSFCVAEGGPFYRMHVDTRAVTVSEERVNFAMKLGHWPGQGLSRDDYETGK